MNTIIMNQDVHTPAFIKADASNKTDNIKQQSISPKQVRRFSWTRFIELTTLLSVVIGVIWLISKVVTPQVVTAVSVIAGFLMLRFIVRVILKVTITLLSILFWLAILCASYYACFEKHSSVKPFILFHQVVISHIEIATFSIFHYERCTFASFPMLHDMR